LQNENQQTQINNILEMIQLSNEKIKKNEEIINRLISVLTPGAAKKFTQL